MARVTRIISDLHYGDRASRVRSLHALRPLLAGVDHLVLNGDTLDTRPSASSARTDELTAEVRAFFPAEVPQVEFLTGNHDPTFSDRHHADLGGGAVFATHGDVVFEDIVPWGMDATVARALVARELGALSRGEISPLEERLAAYRRAAAAIPQRHQSERSGARYLRQFLQDTLWPPTRSLRVLRAWRELPRRAESLVRRYRPNTQCIVVGHTHRPGLWRRNNDLLVVNTGSFCPPLGAWAVDLEADETISLRPVERRNGEFHPGPVRQRFSLARHR